MTYQEKLKDPRWQKKRLEILERDGWMCRQCYDKTKTLHVHHRWYNAELEPWEYEDRVLITLCEDCHKEEPDKSKIRRLLLEDRFYQHAFSSSDYLLINWLLERLGSATVRDMLFLVSEFIQIAESPENIARFRSEREK